MNRLSELTTILSQHLPWHKARLDCLARALIGLLRCRSVNWHDIAVNMPSTTATIESRYKRLQRFFRQMTFDQARLARWLVALFFSETPSWYIAIDRTNWSWGRAHINIFMLSACYEGIAIPLFWLLLPKAGCSTGTEQITLLQRFVKCFGTTPIKAVLADREFPNQQFITWLHQQRIPYYFRIKGNATVRFQRKKYQRADALFPQLIPYRAQVFPMKITLFGQSVFLAGSRNERDELMLVITNADPTVAIATYLRRWEIETLFQSLKGRGFRFEDTHVTQLDRLASLVGFTALAFAWAHKVGEWQALKQPIRWKRFGTQWRPQASYFKGGLDRIRDCLSHMTVKTSQFRDLIEQLCVPKPSPGARQ